MVTFAPFELEYLKIIVKYIMESEAKEISQTHALHKIGEVTTKKLTQTEAEKILQKFNEHQWLRFSPDKPNIRLSTRFIAEMEPFLKKNYKGSCQQEWSATGGGKGRSAKIKNTTCHT